MHNQRQVGGPGHHHVAAGDARRQAGRWRPASSSRTGVPCTSSSCWFLRFRRSSAALYLTYRPTDSISPFSQPAAAADNAAEGENAPHCAGGAAGAADQRLADGPSRASAAAILAGAAAAADADADVHPVRRQPVQLAAATSRQQTPAAPAPMPAARPAAAAQATRPAAAAASGQGAGSRTAQQPEAPIRPASSTRHAFLFSSPAPTSCAEAAQPAAVGLKRAGSVPHPPSLPSAKRMQV